MKRHQKRVHDSLGDDFKCNVCSKLFKEENNLQRHVAHFHSTQELLKCDDCNKTFKTKNYFNTHIRKVHKPKSETQICDICGRSFLLPSDLKKHIANFHAGQVQ